MPKQTSIEWLVKQLKERGYAGEFPPHLLFDQAKQMHKEEISESFFGGIKSTGEGWNGEYANASNPNVETVFRKEYEQYCNKTYGGNNE
jgi:hypothetical protein